jgi:hypothetical protein
MFRRPTGSSGKTRRAKEGKAGEGKAEGKEEEGKRISRF